MFWLDGRLSKNKNKNARIPKSPRFCQNMAILSAISPVFIECSRAGLYSPFRTPPRSAGPISWTCAQFDCIPDTTAARKQRGSPASIPFPSRFPHVCPPSLLNVLPFPNTLRRLTVIRRKVSASADCLDPPTPRSLPTRNPSAVSLFLSLPGECTFGHCTPFPPLTPVLIEMSRQSFLPRTYFQLLSEKCGYLTPGID